MNGLFKRTVVWVGLIGVFACPLIARAEEPQAASAAKSAGADQITLWINDLDDGHYRVREDASQHLMAAGAAALDPLLAVANADKPEPADRAIWIMRRLGRSRDAELALAALERLVKLQNRPTIVAWAEVEFGERSLALCEERLTPLGAEMDMRLELFETGTIPILVVHLGEKWHGTRDDLRKLTQLRQQRNFRLEGTPVDDEVVKLFAEKEKLEVLVLVDTKVTPAAVDAVKVKHPGAIVFVRNQAFLGVGTQPHAGGVVVTRVQPGSAAANAGILEGDVIATIDGHAIPDFDRLTARIAQHQPGDKVELEVVRSEKRMKITPVLGSRPTEQE